MGLSPEAFSSVSSLVSRSSGILLVTDDFPLISPFQPVAEEEQRLSTKLKLILVWAPYPVLIDKTISEAAFW